LKCRWKLVKIISVWECCSLDIVFLNLRRNLK